ncbi:MAG: Twitching motility protein [Candidatus Peregrinibacteria bacterium GW2011_GWA2_33_10]|nr:MAG: Twitching motility protein [Candidatus Peregrinibacteria bacterium GW2011_GWA2_33_10]KKP39608.1 MAG: twitching motility protein, twitching motility protein PilT [Candidatus Peregrinibacteria bacterium GW2011_GWC2_33_13]OGJ50254.1 MAG: type IV pili twitching motility protein PilT [Candidatus Peregrinibacteria bacterium RIFOXYA2_FULL_33_7]
MNLEAVLSKVVEYNAPDLHLRVGMPPIIRMSNGELFPIEGILNLTEAQILAIGKKIGGEEKFKVFGEHKEVDFSYGLEKVGRFRVNLFMERNGASIAFRSIHDKIPTITDLGLPDVLNNLALKPRGLVLITGPTGSGKSTTIASMIDLINETRRCHILTIEDPIEYVHASKRSLITQREVNQHTDSFLNAIKSSLRQDPDVILVGEMRDLETMSAAITLAETGHLVLSTSHTVDVAQTVDRIIDVFPAGQQQQIRAQLSSCLKGVVSQTLIPKLEGNGRALAYEVMLVNDAIANCIKEGNIKQIFSMIQIGKESGMNTLDDCLINLANNRIISEKNAIAKARDPEYVKGNL